LILKLIDRQVESSWKESVFLPNLGGERPAICMRLRGEENPATSPSHRIRKKKKKKGELSVLPNVRERGGRGT